MSWQNQQHTHISPVDRQCKIRKRGGSSSSSSSLVRRYRLKRAILVGKRGGSSTPVPTWKTTISAARSSPCAAVMMPNAASDDGEELAKQQQRPASKDGGGGGGGGKGKGVPLSVSARKLAATLWEINEVPLKKKDAKAIKEMRIREGVAQMPSLAGSLPPKLSDPSYTPISEVGLFYFTFLLCLCFSLFCIFWAVKILLIFLSGFLVFHIMCHHFPVSFCCKNY